MHDSQISNIEATVLRYDHELRLPQFFVVGNDVMIAVPFADLELSLISAELDLQVSELVGVDRCEAEDELALLLLVGRERESAAGHVESDLELVRSPVPRLDAPDVHRVEEGLLGDLERPTQLFLADVFVLSVFSLPA